MKLYQDENGQDVSVTSDRGPSRSVFSAEALQMAMLCMARELDRPDMTNLYTAEELRSAMMTLGDILVQRGCDTDGKNDHLTALIDVMVYG